MASNVLKFRANFMKAAYWAYAVSVRVSCLISVSFILFWLLSLLLLLSPFFFSLPLSLLFLLNFAEWSSGCSSQQFSEEWTDFLLQWVQTSLSSASQLLFSFVPYLPSLLSLSLPSSFLLSLSWASRATVFISHEHFSSRRSAKRSLIVRSFCCNWN